MKKSHASVLQTLRSARQAKGLSQRALSKRVGLPQSHLSRIENGAVDVQLSNLIQIARALDFELALVPRQLLPALGALQRDVESTPATNTTRLHEALLRVEAKARLALPSLNGRDHEAMEQLLNLIETARDVRIGPELARQLDERLKDIDRQLDVIAEQATHAQRKSRIERLVRKIESQRGLHNQLMHQAERPSSNQMPAYQLPDDGG